MKRRTKIAIGAASLLAVVILFLLGSRMTGDRSSRNESADFPKKPITLLVPYAAAGGTDTTARALAKATEKVLGQPIIVVTGQAAEVPSD